MGNPAVAQLRLMATIRISRWPLGQRCETIAEDIPCTIDAPNRRVWFELPNDIVVEEGYYIDSPDLPEKKMVAEIESREERGAVTRYQARYQGPHRVP